MFVCAKIEILNQKSLCIPYIARGLYTWNVTIFDQILFYLECIKERKRKEWTPGFLSSQVNQFFALFTFFLYYENHKIFAHMQTFIKIDSSLFITLTTTLRHFFPLFSLFSVRFRIYIYVAHKKEPIKRNWLLRNNNYKWNFDMQIAN